MGRRGLGAPEGAGSAPRVPALLHTSRRDGGPPLARPAGCRAPSHRRRPAPTSSRPAARRPPLRPPQLDCFPFARCFQPYLTNIWAQFNGWVYAPKAGAPSGLPQRGSRRPPGALAGLAEHVRGGPRGGRAAVCRPRPPRRSPAPCAPLPSLALRPSCRPPDWYTFWLSSDDGSRLYINNTLVVDNGARTRCHTV